MLAITKEAANGCSCYCKPDFHRLSRAWHIRGKFSKRGPAAAAVPKQLDFCCQPGMEAGLGKLLTVSCNALSALTPVGALSAKAELNGWWGQYKLQDPGEHWRSFKSLPSKRGHPSSKGSRGEWRHSFNAELCASVRAESILLLNDRLPVPTQNL